MKSYDLERSIGRDLTILATAGLYSLSAIGCGNGPEERGDLWFDESIDGVRVAYFNDPDRMEIYGPKGDLVEIIEDDGNDEVGDDSDDRYTIFLKDGRSRTYAENYFIDERGIEFKEGEDAIANNLVQYSRGVLKTVTGKYRGLKSKISSILTRKCTTK
ncbi:hypothetical protein J4442_00905 [Candidatus Woesearchaeota archaeon]|nr:hypothetical protein [Candidatus Woesearchaeota archaeon]